MKTVSNDRLRLVFVLTLMLSAIGVISVTSKLDLSHTYQTIPQRVRTSDPHQSQQVPSLRQQLTSSTDNRSLINLGNRTLPPDGQIRVVLCPRHQPDPIGGITGNLQLTTTTGTPVTIENTSLPLTPDRTRGNRCLSAEHENNSSSNVRVSVTMNNAQALAENASLEIQVTRRIRPYMGWPSLLSVICLAIVMLKLYPKELESPDTEVPSTAMVQRSHAPISAIGALLLTVLATGLVIEFLPFSGIGLRSLAGNLFLQLGLVVMSIWFLGGFSSTALSVVLSLQRPTGKQLGVSVLSSAALIAIAYATSEFVPDLSESPMGRLIEQVPVRYTLAYTALIAPLAEELFYRGIILPVYGRKYIWLGVLASVFIFTIAHAQQLSGTLIGLVPIASVAIVTSLLRVYTKSLSTPWLVHTLYNLGLSISMYFVSSPS